MDTRCYVLSAIPSAGGDLGGGHEGRVAPRRAGGMRRVRIVKRNFSPQI